MAPWFVPGEACRGEPLSVIPTGVLQSKDEVEESEALLKMGAIIWPTP